jgi:hypothetical protein
MWGYAAGRISLLATTARLEKTAFDRGWRSAQKQMIAPGKDQPGVGWPTIAMNKASKCPQRGERDENPELAEMIAQRTAMGGVDDERRRWRNGAKGSTITNCGDSGNVAVRT